MQVVRLCRQHHLFTALAYLFPRALLDYVAPVAELIVAIAVAKSDKKSHAGYKIVDWDLPKTLAFKLLVYLRTSFAGLTFPPG